MVAKPDHQVNIHDAKTHLSRYIARVAAGETVVIARAGKPIAKLVPVAESASEPFSILGSMRGQGVSDDEVFRALDDEIAKMITISVDRLK